MTLTLFLTLLMGLSAVSSLITEALKKQFGDEQPTIYVLITSAIVGWGGGAIAYSFMGIPFIANNILALVLLAPACFLTATVGYDKVREVILQFFNK